MLPDAAPPEPGRIAPRRLRDALGRFATGVTVVTTRGPDGKLPLHWFDLPDQPIASFAGIWRPLGEGRAFAFLTCEPNAMVGAVHPKAMPVILTTPDEVETWMTAPADEVLKLQRPLPDGSLRVVARGVKEDPIGPTT